MLRGCWFSVGPAMLAGAKGRTLVSAMPQDRIVLESDGPFAQTQRLGLHPWDISQSYPWLASIWEFNQDRVEATIRANELALLSTVDREPRGL